MNVLNIAHAFNVNDLKVVGEELYEKDFIFVAKYLKK